MARMTKSERAEKQAARKATEEKLAKLRAEAWEIVQSGKCPQCGSKLRSNLAIMGWWQCSQYGADGFRADTSRAACSFQCFTV